MEIDGIAKPDEQTASTPVKANSLIIGISDAQLEALCKQWSHTDEEPTLWYIGSGPSLVIFHRAARQEYKRYQSRVSKEGANVTDEAEILFGSVVVWPDSKPGIAALLDKFPGRPGNVAGDCANLAMDEETKRAKKVPRPTGKPTKT